MLENNLPLNSVPGLSTRIQNILCFDLHCETVGDVAELTKEEILYAAGVGASAVKEIREIFGKDL